MQEWNHNEGRKNGKSCEIVFMMAVNKQSTNINNNRQGQMDANPCAINHICIKNSNNNDADSNIIALNDKFNINESNNNLPTPKPCTDKTATNHKEYNHINLSSFRFMYFR